MDLALSFRQLAAQMFEVDIGLVVDGAKLSELGDDIARCALMLGIESEYGITITLGEEARLTTLGDVLGLVREKWAGAKVA